jgi:superfamily I DNA/RNA helicase
MNIENLTAAQAEAIHSNHPNVLVAAGPGSGKTATTVERIKRLVVDGTPPERIVAITFTNAAAGELQERLTYDFHRITPGTLTAVPEKQTLRLGHVGTLHSFCLRMLKEYGAPFGYGERTALVSPESAEDLLASKARSLGSKTPLRKLLELKSSSRPSYLGLSPTKDETVLMSYYDDLREAGILDFDAILDEFLSNLKDNYSFRAEIADRFDHLFVDEVQDSARIDWTIYLVLPIKNKFMVGDPDQSLYGFRGARPDDMVDRAKEPGTHLIMLEENFRSRSEICEAAQCLIEHQRDRINKVTRSVKGSGGRVEVLGPFANEGEEIGAVLQRIAAKDFMVPFSEVAILCRTNALAARFQASLEATAIPVVRRQKSDLPADWARCRALVELLVRPDNDALAYFYLAATAREVGLTDEEARAEAHRNRLQSASQGQSINRRNWGFSTTRVENVPLILEKQHVSRESRMLVAERIRELPVGTAVLDLALAMATQRDVVKEEGEVGVRVLTIHGAKGLEFDAVFVVGLEDELMPGRRQDVDVDEERRVLYVAMTRARERLYLSYATSRGMTYGKFTKIEPRTPSRFLEEIKP